jgi:ADP-heptose:LPS heptosyltransferase
VAYNIEGYELDNFIKLFEGILIDGGEGSHPLKLEGSLDIDASSQDWAKEQMNSKFVILFLGASIILKRLNEEQVMTIIHHCLEKNYSIALLGGRDVEQFAQGIAVQSNSPKVFNYASKISLMQSGALIQRSSLFIGPDSGLMHMACAIGVPVIGIFGPSNLAKWGPKGAKNKVITENVSCSPCTRFGYTVPTCNGSYHCMKNIKIDRVIHGLNENS